MSEKLRQAFLDKEKADLYLFNLDKLKQEEAIEEMYYKVLKTEYAKLSDEAASKIEAIKADLQKLLDAKLKESAVAKLNHKYLEIRYKVGQINANTFLKQEQGPKKKIAELEKSIKELQALVNATNSAELPGKSGIKKPEFKLPDMKKPEPKPADITKQPETPPAAAPRPIPLMPAAAEQQPTNWTTIEEAPPMPVMEMKSPDPLAQPLPKPIIIQKKYVPPGLSVTDLEILPDRVNSGNHIGIIAMVKNVGQDYISHMAELKINDETRDTAEIKLNPGQTQELTFLVMAGLPGEYKVDLEGQESKFTVVPD